MGKVFVENTDMVWIYMVWMDIYGMDGYGI